MRCEGYRKYGSFMTLGPRKWKQCENEAIVMIRFEDRKEEQTLPACAACWQDCIDTKLHILEVTPIKKEEAQ
jgi:hypothetical protein